MAAVQRRRPSGPLCVQIPFHDYSFTDPSGNQRAPLVKSYSSMRPNRPSSFTVGYTPLMHAACRGRADLPFADALLRHGAVLDLNSAAGLQWWAVVREKLKTDFRGVRQAPVPEKLLFQAIRSDKPEIVKLLLERGADPQALADNVSVCPLRMAVQYEALASMRLLLEHGADPNQQDQYAIPEKRSILEDARALGRRAEFIDLLTQFGAK